MTTKPASVCAAPHSHHINDCFTNAQGPVHVRDVLAGEQFFQQWHERLSDPDWPTPAEVMRAAADLARGRAERQGQLTLRPE